MSDSARDLFHQASGHDSAGREQEAIPLYERALAAGLDDDLVPRALLQLGSSLRNVGRADDAAALLAEACRRHPGDAALPHAGALERYTRELA